MVADTLWHAEARVIAQLVWSFLLGAGIRMLAHRWQIDLLAILSLMVAIATVYIVVPLIL